MSKVILVILLTIVYLIWIRYFDYEKTSDSWLECYKRQLSYYFGTYEVLSFEEKRYEHVGCTSTYYTMKISYYDFMGQKQIIFFNSKLKPFESFILNECKRISLEQFRSLSGSDSLIISEQGYESEEDYYDRIQSFSLLSLTTMQPCNFFVFFPTVYLVVSLCENGKESELKDYVHTLLKETNHSVNCIVRGARQIQYIFHGKTITCNSNKEYEHILLKAS